MIVTPLDSVTGLLRGAVAFDRAGDGLAPLRLPAWTQ